MKILIGLFAENIDEAEKRLENSNKENCKFLDKLVDEVDSSCNNYLTNYSLIVPKKTVRLLSSFFDNILQERFFDSEIYINKEQILEFDDFLEQLVKDPDDISFELRKDLNIDALNSSLLRRIK
ncbi:hypothetical protein ACWGOQ_0019880 [Aquimarina sp. M1]